MLPSGFRLVDGVTHEQIMAAVARLAMPFHVAHSHGDKLEHGGYIRTSRIVVEPEHVEQLVAEVGRGRYTSSPKNSVEAHSYYGEYEVDWQEVDAGAFPLGVRIWKGLARDRCMVMENTWHAPYNIYRGFSIARMEPEEREKYLGRKPFKLYETSLVG